MKQSRPARSSLHRAVKLPTGGLFSKNLVLKHQRFPPRLGRYQNLNRQYHSHVFWRVQNCVDVKGDVPFSFVLEIAFVALFAFSVCFLLHHKDIFGPHPARILGPSVAKGNIVDRLESGNRRFDSADQVAVLAFSKMVSGAASHCNGVGKSQKTKIHLPSSNRLQPSFIQDLPTKKPDGRPRLNEVSASEASPIKLSEFLPKFVKRYVTA